MTPEALDKAIACLLEANPTQQKPARKNKNKQKDLIKRVRQGKSIVSDKFVQELVGDEVVDTINTVHIGYKDTDRYLGTVEAWYDRIKDIAHLFGVDVNKISLKKVTRYDWDDGKVLWDGESFVYEKVREVTLRYYSGSGKLLRSRGVYRNIYIDGDIPLEEGVYQYTDEVKGIISDYICTAPAREVVHKRDLNRYKYDSNKLFKHDKEGRYEHYRKAMKEIDTTHYYSDTIRHEKGDLVGTRNRLITAVNDNSKKGFPLFEGIDSEVLDYETAYYDVEYEYVW